MPYEVLSASAGRYEVLPNADGSIWDAVKQGAGNLAAGAVRGAGSIGATLLAPVDMAADALTGKGLSLESNRARRAGMDAGLETLGAEPDSMLYKGGKLAGEIAGTAGAGGVLANGVRGLGATRFASGLEPVVNGVARGLETGGFRVGELAGTGLGTAARIGTGAATGGLAAGMVNPQDAGIGALIGGALPGAVQLAGAAGRGVRNAVLPQASPEVAKLASRAEQLGITIPADRLVDSRPLNAVAASLNYVPLSGRAAAEDAMNSQLNRAVSRTFGQDSSNVTAALRQADQALGGQFDTFLKQNTVRVDQQFVTDLADVANRAVKELGSDQAGIIGRQVDEIARLGANGQIDGQAAYNIKKTLDNIGKRNSPEAFYALDLKGKLMDALNRSVGPDKAKAFSDLRKQYGNMLSLEKLAPNGAEGELSAARLGNMRNINNPQLQELADIAAQFVKGREGQHGAAQRVFGGLGALGAGTLGALGLPIAGAAATGAGVTMAGARGINGLLNSQGARNAVLGNGLLQMEPEALGLLTRGAFRSAPLLPAQ